MFARALSTASASALSLALGCGSEPSSTSQPVSGGEPRDNAADAGARDGAASGGGGPRTNDAGTDLDAGGRPEGSVDAAGGGKPDAPASPDAGGATDAGGVTDAGAAFDAGGATDAGPPPAGCQQHADCESAVCDRYAREGRGECIAAERVLYVSRACGAAEGGTGTRAEPFCQIREALPAAAVSAQKDVIRVLPGIYLPFHVEAQKVALYGPAGEGGVASVFEEDAGAASVGAGADVILDGFALGGTANYGLRCESQSGTARATVRGSTLGSDTSVALRASGCDVSVDRSTLRGLRGAIALTNSRYQITNSWITGVSEGPAVRVSGGAGLFEHVTVTDNYVEDIGPPRPYGPFDCGASPVEVRDSIVVQNSTFRDTGSQFSGECRLTRVAVGGDSTASEGAIREAPVLEQGYELAQAPENASCCVDRAASNLLWDIDFTSRPQGGAADLGAHELAR